MVLEVSQVSNAAVVTASGKKLAEVDRVIIDGHDIKLAGFQVKQRKVIQKFAALEYTDVLDCERQTVIVDDDQKFSSDLKHFDALDKQFGRVIGVTAKTESGQKIGKVTDLLFEVETSLISRFYIGNLFSERIIPQQFVVAITPSAIVFKDVVTSPIFDDIATMPAESVPTAAN